MLKTNNEEKTLKAAREKWDTLYYRETKIRIRKRGNGTRQIASDKEKWSSEKNDSGSWNFASSLTNDMVKPGWTLFSDSLTLL